MEKFRGYWLKQSVLLFICFFSCCHDKNPKIEIMATSKKFLKSINEGDSIQFKELIGMRNKNVTSINDELLVDRMNRCKILLNKYVSNDSFKIVITNQYDELHRRLVKVPIFSGYDTTSKLLNATLTIFFGPPQVVPLSKVTDFELNCQYDDGHGGTYPFPPPSVYRN